MSDELTARSREELRMMLHALEAATIQLTNSTGDKWRVASSYSGKQARIQVDVSTPKANNLREAVEILTRKMPQLTQDPEEKEGANE